MSCSLHGSALDYIGRDTENHRQQPFQFNKQKRRSDRLFNVTPSVTGESVSCDSQSLCFSTVTRRHSGLVSKENISTVVFPLFCHVKKMFR